MRSSLFWADSDELAQLARRVGGRGAVGRRAGVQVVRTQASVPAPAADPSLAPASGAPETAEANSLPRLSLPSRRDEPASALPPAPSAEGPLEQRLEMLRDWARNQEWIEDVFAFDLDGLPVIGGIEHLVLLAAAAGLGKSWAKISRDLRLETGQAIFAQLAEGQWLYLTLLAGTGHRLGLGLLVTEEFQLPDLAEVAQRFDRELSA